MREAAHRRPAVADGRVGDVDERLPQQRQGVEGPVVALDGGVAGRGAHADTAAADLDPVEAADVVDVDQVGGRGEAHRQQRHQALAAREDLAVGPDLGQHVEGLLERRRPVVDERRRLHESHPPSPGRA